MGTQQRRNPPHDEPPATMPHSIEAEEATLGSVLISPDALAVVCDDVRLVPGDFYRDNHATIYRHMLALREAGTPVDLVMLLDALQTAGKLDEVGGAAAVSSLDSSVPSSDNAAHYARIVKRHSQDRQAATLGERIFKRGFAGGVSLDEVVAWRASLDALATDAGQPGNAGRFVLRSVKEMLSQPRPEPLIDRHLSMNATSILYGPSGVGKSVLLLDMMAHVAFGWAWQGHQTQYSHVVYVCAEGQVYMPERLQAWMLAHEVEDIPNLHILDVAPQLLEPATVPDLIASITAQLPELPRWIVFDTVSQTSEGLDENDNSQVRDYTRALARIREATGAHVTAVHHTGKDDTKGARGAAAFKANVDTLIEIAAQGAGAVMRCEKQRGGWTPFKNFPYRVVKLALDEYADHTGPIIEPGEAQPASPTGDLLDSDAIALGTLQGHPEGLTAGDWERASIAAGVKERTFQNARKRLMDSQFVTRNDDRYFITPNGVRSVQLHRSNGAIAPSVP